MDDLTWTSENNTYHINLNMIKKMCFELINIFYAQGYMQQIYELGCEEDEEEEWDDPISSLHDDLVGSEVSRLLLHLSLLVRTYDDIMKKSENSAAYQEHIKQQRWDDVGICSNS